ncbi:MAG TPA: M42 family metallopeptidase [Clostridia bacterium]|nr:M42 family metallopeptidase [Clostridia bacterium]
MNGEVIAPHGLNGSDAFDGSNGADGGAGRQLLREQLNRLCLISAVSGFEGEATSGILDCFKGLYDESRTDTLGNCIMVKRGEISKNRGLKTGQETVAYRDVTSPSKFLERLHALLPGAGYRDVASPTKPSPIKASFVEPSPIKVMLAAHVDEVGLVVTRVEDGGFLRFTCTGKIDPRVLPGAEVLVLGKEKLPGVIGSVPPHLRERRKSDEERQAVGFDDLYVDTGLPGERLKEMVRVGDPMRFASTCVSLGENRLAGRALDDRVGLLAVRVCLGRLMKSRHEADVFAVATTGEEIGLKGATVAAYGIHPDVAIAVDATFGLEPGVAEHEGSKLGEGPAIGIGPNVHPRIAKTLLQICNELNIPHQVEVIPGPSGTDAWAVQISREGVPTALVSIPVRSMHTPSEVVDLRDIEWAGRLLAEFVIRLDSDSLGKMSEAWL